MSAWCVSKVHIDLLVTAGLDFPNRQCHDSELRWSPPASTLSFPAADRLTQENADSIGGMLWAENYASVHHRYPDIDGEQLPGPIDFDPVQTLTYTFEKVPGPIDPVVVLKAIACYQYQSCEHPAWASSNALAMTTALQGAAIHVLPGWGAAPWGFDNRKFFARDRRLADDV